jgi:hypothetical protein
MKLLKSAESKATSMVIWGLERIGLVPRALRVILPILPILPIRAIRAILPILPILPIPSIHVYPQRWRMQPGLTWRARGDGREIAWRSRRSRRSGG